MNRYKKCIYKGHECEIRRENPDHTVAIIALDGYFAMADGGWKRVDKFEWEKSVSKDEVKVCDQT
ncbi:MAG: hypothetical protein Q7T05_04915 [Dehalococcoidia bacterium]|jgi:hypothetical protein|nr:hypothetical protein [Dehalococcoidia bacterium]